jgi:ATP-dependent RNA helicase DDX5/DBP2
MAKDLFEVLRESQNDIPYDLRSVMESHRHERHNNNNFNPYRRWGPQNNMRPPMP